MFINNIFVISMFISQERVVYVNYGRVEDYQLLMSNDSRINLTGAIFIARYGKIFRGDKVLSK